MNRILVFAYGVVSYVVSLATFAYMAGFIGNFLTPTRLDGPAQGPLWVAFAVNLGLIALFGVQHSVMARKGFKQALTRYIPAAAERSTYLLFSCLAMLAMFVLWRPMGGTIWEITEPAGRNAMYALYAFGWGLLLLCTFLINHFDLFGLRQIWLHLTGQPYTMLRFRTPGPYRLVRHPLYIGWIVLFWATPTMTAAHFLFALGTTAYILIAIRYEERDLVREFGESYEAYRRRVPMILPMGGERPSQAPAKAVAVR